MPLERAVGQAMLKTLVPQGLTAWQMIQIVRGAGAGYRYQTMLSDIREYTGRLRYETQIRNMTSNSVIPDIWQNRVDMAGPYKYKVWADVTYYDPTTNEYVTDVRSMYTDELKKIGDYGRDFEDVLSGAGCRCDMEFMKIDIRGMDFNTRLQ